MALNPGGERERERERRGTKKNAEERGREKGGRETRVEGCVERGDKGTEKELWQRRSVDRRVEPAKRGNVATRLL